MSEFNKFDPNRPAPDTSAADAMMLRRARILRYSWIVSTLMLITGYVIVALVLAGKIR